MRHASSARVEVPGKTGYVNGASSARVWRFSSTCKGLGATSGIVRARVEVPRAT